MIDWEENNDKKNQTTQIEQKQVDTGGLGDDFFENFKAKMWPTAPVTQKPAEINAAPATPENRPGLDLSWMDETQEQATSPDAPNIPNAPAPAPAQAPAQAPDTRTDEQIIEDYVEANPEEAKEILPESSDLHKEAEQVGDSDKRTDEVRDEAVEEFVEKEPELADTIVEEAADDNTVLDDMAEDDTVNDDFFNQYSQELKEKNEEEQLTPYDVNEWAAAPIEDKIRNYSDEDKRYLRAADRMGLLKEWEEREGGAKWQDEDGHLQFRAGTPAMRHNYDKIIKEYKKTLDSIPEFYTVPSDLSSEDLVVAARQARKKTKEQYGFTKDDAQAELLYRQGKGSVLDTRPQPRWDTDRIQDFQSSLNKAANAINPNDPESIKELARLQRKRNQLLTAIKQKKYEGMLNNTDSADIDTDIEGKIEVARPIEDEVLETAIDPNEAAMELMKQEAKEKKAEQKRFAEFVKQQSAEIKKKYNGEEYVDPEEKKKLNDADKQLAIYDPKAIMVVEEQLEETDEILEEKEEKIRKRWGLPKLLDNYHGKQMGVGGAAGFAQTPTKEVEGARGGGARLSSKAGSFPTGHGGAAVSFRSASEGVGAGKRLEAEAGRTSPVKSTGPEPNVELVETPGASSKGNKGQAGATVEGGAVTRPVGGMIGWNSVSNKGGGRFAANKGKAPRFGSSSGGSGAAGAKLSAKKQADARNITKRDVAQKILAESRNWEVNERGERDSGAELLPVRLFVKDDHIDVSILGTGRKRKSLDGVNDQELALIQKMI